MADTKIMVRPNFYPNKAEEDLELALTMMMLGGRRPEAVAQGVKHPQDPSFSTTGGPEAAMRPMQKSPYEPTLRPGEWEEMDPQQQKERLLTQLGNILLSAGAEDAHMRGISGHRPGSMKPPPARIRPGFEKQFLGWYGKSKLGYEDWLNKKPKTVYHGTPEPGSFTKLDKTKLDRAALYGPGFYFTEDPSIATGQVDDGLPSKPGYTSKGAMQRFSGADWGKVGDALVSSPELRQLVDSGKLSADALELLRVHLDKAASGFGSSLNTLSNGPFNLPVMQILERAGLPVMLGGGVPAHLSIQNPLVMEESIPGNKVQQMLKALPTTRFGAFDEPVDLTGNELFDLAENIFSKVIQDNAGGGTIPEEAVLGQARQQTVDWLRSFGYDGITHMGGAITGGKPHRVWIAFDPGQVKSATGNEGSYDPSNPDIRK